MILLLHPRTVTRLEIGGYLSVLAVAAMLEGKYEYEIVSSNIDLDPSATLRNFARELCEALAVSAMPDRKWSMRLNCAKTFRREFPRIPIIWGWVLCIALSGCRAQQHLCRLRRPRPG